MAAPEFIVIRDRGDWAVRQGDIWLGRYISCPRAIRAAVEAADKAVFPEGSTEVVVERSPFDRYTVWIAGRDGLSL